MFKRILPPLILLVLAFCMTVAVYAGTLGNFQYGEISISGVKGISITKYTGSDERVVVPETIDGLPVINIGREAFRNKDAMKYIDLPSTLKTVTTYAFYDCDGLVYVIFPDGLEEIGNRAFHGCEKLEYAYVPLTATTTGMQTFEGTPFLEKFLDFVIAACVRDDMTDIEKALAVHDYIVSHYQYDVGYVEGSLRRYGITDLFLFGNAVCQGYTRAFQKIMNKLGIETIMVVSNAMGHAWNMIHIGSSWYHVDATWDDPVSGDTDKDHNSTIFHSLFLLSDGAITNAKLVSPNGATADAKHFGWTMEDGSPAPVADNTQYDKAKWENSEALRSDIIINYETLFIEKDESNVLLGFIPEHPAGTPVTWSSSHPWIINIDEHGIVTALNYGRATITATATVHGHDVMGTCDVYVLPGGVDDEQPHPELHYLNHFDAKAPTCTEPGWNEYVECTVCGYTTYDDIPAHGHDMVEHPAQLPTDTEDGWGVYSVCNDCGFSTFVELSALGHDKKTHEAKAATCTEIGWNSYETCSRCEYSTYTEISALGHNIKNYDAKAPTCTEVGFGEHEACTRCDYSTRVDVPALGHAIKNNEAKAPTCTETGYGEYESCTRCDYSTRVEIPALGHDLVEGEITDDGMYYDCTRCDHSEFHSNAIIGDCDGDEKITILDAALILQFKAGWNVEIIEDAADTDGDGKITILDAALILQFKAGWNVEFAK